MGSTAKTALTFEQGVEMSRICQEKKGKAEAAMYKGSETYN